MWFIDRREDQSICGAWPNQQWEGQESLSDGDAGLAAFFASLEMPERTPEQKLAALGLSISDLKQLLNLE